MTPQSATRLTAEQKTLIRETLAKEAPEAEFQKFVAIIERNGLDPFTGQVMLSKRWDNDSKDWKWTVQTNISGLRVIAERNGYEGQLGPFWCGRDGDWHDVWLEDEQPAAAKVGILKAGFREPLWGVARWKSYVQTRRDGGVTMMWAKMGDVMIAKCAEANGLRRAYPQQMAGLYSEEEMEQADEPIDQSPLASRQVPASTPQTTIAAARVEPHVTAREQPPVAHVDESKPANSPPPAHDPVTGEVLVTVPPDALELPQLKELLVKGLGHNSSTAMAFLTELAGRPIKRMGELTLINCQDGIEMLTTYKARLGALSYGDQDPAGRDKFLESILKRPMTSPLTFSEVLKVISEVDNILQPAQAAATATAAPTAADDASW